MLIAFCLCVIAGTCLGLSKILRKWPIKNWKKVGKNVVWSIVIILPIVVVVWWFFTPGKKPPPPPPDTGGVVTETSSGLPAKEPPERWVVNWSLENGQHVRGLNSDTLEVVIRRSDEKVLDYDTPYTYREKREVSHTYLSKTSRNKFEGTWSQEHPKDGGDIYLNYQGSNVWTGQMKGTAGIPATVTLMKK